ncbi:MAG TPA: hypothetical protein VKC54_00195 [Patescibacteria group bacterium]|nr:hypothetical protein [Patescibacteria group bacterium]
MTLQMKERESKVSISNHRAEESGATRRFMESMARRKEEHEEMLKKLQVAKNNLPDGKEMLNLEEVSHRLRSLYYGKTMPTEFIESCEINYYLDFPELKNTNEFIRMINSQYREP